MIVALGKQNKYLLLTEVVGSPLLLIERQIDRLL